LRHRLACPLSVCLLIVFALVLSACGSGDDSSGAEGQIEATITTSVTSTEPSKCTELMTSAFREQNSGLQGNAALEKCEEEAGDTSDDPDSVDISEIEVDGSDATARVGFVGGGFDGQALDVGLLNKDGKWKLDKIEGFAKLDNEALAKTLEERFEATSSEITPEQVSCIGDGIRKAPQEEVEELLLSGSNEKFVELAEACEE
jgi:hypothetical protein